MDLTGPKPQVRRVALNANGQPAFNMHNFDAWFGTHWSVNILWPLLCPERYHDLCETSLEMFRNGGLIPRGPSGGNYTFVMIGDSAAPALTAAYHKGIRDFDASQLLRGLVRNTEADGGRYYGGYATAPAPKVHAEYESKGYVSWGNFLGGYHNKAVSSFTLYNAYHDWCIAQLARSLGETNLAEKFMKGAGNWRNVIWPEKQCAWVRLPDGSWKQGFKPVDEVFEQDGFCEASAAMSTFFVPHDPPGLAEHLGGADALAAKLDEYFQRSEPQGFIAGKHSRSHASVFVDYSNQDSTGMAHFFNRIGQPWNRSLLPHSELIQGGTLELVLGPEPNMKWGVE
jgi:putative alpha-1,2-mannosidase